MRAPRLRDELHHHLWTARLRLVGALLDRLLGVETARPVRLATLGLAAPERGEYEPSGWRTVRRALTAADVAPGDVLLDAGSGKGRMVLAAAALPFARIVGVEIAPTLHEQAERNLTRYRGPRRAGAIELVCADATERPVDDDVTHVLLYNPFEGALFDRFLDRVEESQARRPRVVRFVYLGPLEGELLRARGAGRVPLRGRGDDLEVYDLAPV